MFENRRRRRKYELKIEEVTPDGSIVSIFIIFTLHKILLSYKIKAY
jgi:hypothetical protein